MNEVNLQLARAMVAEESIRSSRNSSPDVSPTRAHRQLDERLRLFSVDVEIIESSKMNALWVGSDVDLPTLHKCRLAEKLEFRLTCLVNNKARSEHSMKTYDEVFDRLDYDSSPKQTRSGTWPRTRSLNAPSPVQHFGPCGRIMKNSAMVM
ncbi:hypothetical protein HUJ05_010396 [Dendroctonus ponderosae]|nr:hypothetical protein HUJ05_010396 [Dendroctonus ponderosae]